MKTLVIGGARSGKSALAEKIALECPLGITYIATATGGDAEMQQRIQTHRARRPPQWNVVEEPIALASVLQMQDQHQRLLLVDCITLWLTNLLLHPDPSCFLRERTALLEVLPSLRGNLVIVSNETGQGIVPLGALSRRFVDEAGWLNQALAQHCDQVYLTVAGLPLVLKGGQSCP